MKHFAAQTTNVYWQRTHNQSLAVDEKVKLVAPIAKVKTPK